MITWRPAQLQDVPALVAFTSQHYQQEIDGMLTADPDKLCANIAHAILNRNFDIGSELIQLAEQDNQLIGWCWIGRGTGTDYTNDATAEAHMLHLDLTLPARTRIRMINQCLSAWEQWCETLRIPVLVSTTRREDWQTFMELHRRRGYIVRGSHAFKKINIKEQQ